LEVAYRAIRRGAAPGVDEVTWHCYGQQLEANLHDLHARVQRGAYRASPSRRAYIPKADGGLRPLGIAALEDKIVQRAVAEVLNAVYEADFLGFSYGFRPRRSQHDALGALAVAIVRKRVNWVLDADLRGFFDTIDHGWLATFVEHRIADERVLRLIQKWLRAGVIEDGVVIGVDEGVPQGSPMTAPTQWATCSVGAWGRGGDGVADGDRVVVAADEDLADDESQDALLVGDVEVVESVGEAAEEAFERVGELEVGLGVVQLGVEHVELGLQRGLALA
jgi:hypothetical protein